MQRKLLKLLADGRQHSGSDLAAALGITRAAIWKQVKLLREQGIEIAAQAGQGYSLALSLELLERDGIVGALPPDLRRVIDDIQVLWVTESTSDLLLQRGPTDSGRARICLAEYQTGGRGRRGRQWFAADREWSVSFPSDGVSRLLPQVCPALVWQRDCGIEGGAGLRCA